MSFLMENLSVIGNAVTVEDFSSIPFDLQYERLEKKPLGEGTYGEVYKVRCLRTGCIRALKRMKLDQEYDGVPSTAIRETSILKSLDHKNVVKLYDVFCSEKKLHLVFEFMDMDLKKFMKQKTAANNSLKYTEIKIFAKQLIAGVEYLHSSRITHRDLKPQNLLVDLASNTLKIADFGLARAFCLPVPRYTHEVVTVWYRCPEILLGVSKYSIAVDVWSVGCIIAEMATNSPLFPGDSEIDTIFRIFRKLGTPDDLNWPGLSAMPEFKHTFPKWKPKALESIPGLMQGLGEEGIKIVQGFLTYAPHLRLSCRRALLMPYFD
jgi:serine/threonine protein kinase